MAIASIPKIVTEKIDITTTREYIALYELYQDSSNHEEDLVQVEEELYKANSIAKKKFPIWPDIMLWGEIENRPFMRAIQEQACVFGETGMSLIIY